VRVWTVLCCMLHLFTAFIGIHAFIRFNTEFLFNLQFCSWSSQHGQIKPPGRQLQRSGTSHTYTDLPLASGQVRITAVGVYVGLRRSQQTHSSVENEGRRTIFPLILSCHSLLTSS
jgi:hypothetical protein